jgi:hypothetical protein
MTHELLPAQAFQDKWKDVLDMDESDASKYHNTVVLRIQGTFGKILSSLEDSTTKEGQDSAAEHPHGGHGDGVFEFQVYHKVPASPIRQR